MTNAHLESTTRYPACKLNGAQYWQLELAHLVYRRFGKHLNVYTIFDAREYDSFAEAKRALLDMEALELYELNAQVTYTIKHFNGDTFNGTRKEIMKFFKIKSGYHIDRFLAGKVSSSRTNRYNGWRVLN